MKHLIRLLHISLLLLTVLTVTGCGYTNKELFPKQYHTIAVHIFDNHTFYRGVEDDLAEALTKQVQTRTPYAIESNKNAQTVLQGAITNVTQRRVSRSHEGGLSQEIEVKITANFQWKNLLTDKIIMQRSGFVVVGHYVPARPLQGTFSIAQHQAVQRLAEQIVSQMAGGWGD